MNQTIPQSKITSRSAAVIYGKAVGNPASLLKMDSKELVSALFGVTAPDPSAIDITEAIIANLSNAEQAEIRKIIYDRGICGVIWEFVTPKRFMIEMSKIPDGYHHNIHLSLVMANPSNPEEEIISKLLVSFGRKGVEFFNSSEFAIDYNRNSIEMLNKLHDEAVEQLSDKYTKPIAEVGEVQNITSVTIEANKVVTVTEKDESLIITHSLTGKHLFTLKGKYFCDNFKERGNVIVYNPTEFILGKDTDEELLKKFIAATTCEVIAEPEKTPEKKPEEAVNEQPQDTEQIKCEEENRLLVPADSLIHIDCDVEDGDIPTGTIIAYQPAANKDHPVMVGTLRNSEKENLDLLGDYRVKVNIYKKDLACTLEEFVKLLEKCPVMSLDPDTVPETESMAEPVVEKAKETMDVAKETRTPLVDLTVNGKVVGTVEVPVSVETKAEGPEPEQPINKEKEEMTETTPQHEVIKNIRVADEKLQNIAEDLTSTLGEIIVANDDQNDEELTIALRAATDIDNLVVRSEGTDVVIAVAEPEPPAAPEVPSIDIFNVKNQYALLRGLFGTANPAITHVEKFLKEFLTNEKNIAYLSTGTFPTETTVSYTEKPYDVTYSIVKFKDGRFYRIFAAITDKKLSNQGYIETKNIEGRWVKLMDVQNSAYRQDGRGRRY